MPIGKVWIVDIVYCFLCLFVCTVTDFSVEDKASGVKFCTVVHRRTREGISHYGKLCSSKSPKSDKSASARASPTRRSQRLPFGSRTYECAVRKIARRADVGSAYVDIRPFPKTDVLVFICITFAVDSG